MPTRAISRASPLEPRTEKRHLPSSRVPSRPEPQGPFSFDRPFHAAMAQATMGLSPAALVQAYGDWALHLFLSPDKQIALNERARRQCIRYLEYCLRALLNQTDFCIDPLPQDKRFINEDWRQWPFNVFQQGFLLSQQWWHKATTDIYGFSKHHEDVVSFIVRQLLDTVSPTNFPASNPEIIRATAQQGGFNFLRGAVNFWEDARRAAMGSSPVGSEAFEVGKNLATARGKVIYRNRLIELIQYEPVSAAVYPEPILIVPAWIMKYYILDLSPENSLVQYLVAHGHTVFMISWKNPRAQDRDLGLDDYRKLGLTAALDAISEIISNQSVHCVGYCLGGTLLALGAAAMARMGAQRIRSITLFAAQTDFTEAGELMLFIDEAQVAFLEDMMAEKGYLDTKQLASAFQFLRSNDLIWSAVVQTYMLGERPPMFDLMAWNADPTRLPYRMHSEYLRRLFLDNDLAEGRYVIEDHPISLRDIRAPIFCVSTVSDHIAPWRSVYKIQMLTDANVTFVLSNGGHNAGIVSRPGHPGRHYQIATHNWDEIYVDPDAWRQIATLRQGSWWPAWVSWLARLSGRRIAPPPMGAPEKGLVPLCDAPGGYVLEK
ncbi:alpha/beta fold hydrolase (plasmid) [Methylocystis sp. MJC1]|uniref:PHA/PHB synthase family protein n=1 Tax=Methylocystis sp. MJC1 TaxID=2654282 RepID=UPI001FEE95AD|nr:alpha/beta fold hydrolase [Methylocystis sp. MJC1]UZX13865.1 alpha/beta fold hydrolase [Methylocystis sp. MJC1]